MNYQRNQTVSDKARENRLRRVAARQGLVLEKNRRRDPRAEDYGVWYLRRGSETVVQSRNLADIAEHLQEKW